MRTVEFKVYQFHELSEEAKEKARNEWRSREEFDHSDILNFIADAAEMFGLDLRQKRVTLMDDSVDYQPEIYYGLSYSQGDGCSFNGEYRYRKNSLTRVKEELPTSTALHEIVQGVYKAQKLGFFDLKASISPANRERSIRVEVERRSGRRVPEQAGRDLAYWLDQFNHWIFQTIRDEYESTQKDEYVEESIIANEVEFTEDGSIF